MTSGASARQRHYVWELYVRHATAHAGRDATMGGHTLSCAVYTHNGQANALCCSAILCLYAHTRRICVCGEWVCKSAIAVPHKDKCLGPRWRESCGIHTTSLCIRCDRRDMGLRPTARPGSERKLNQPRETAAVRGGRCARPWAVVGVGGVG